MTIEQTTDYDLFKSFISNREIDPKHVKRLARSLKRRNLMYVRPVLVNDEMYVIDGQHRVEACRMIGEPVWFLKIGSLTRADIGILNTAQLNWRQIDFINFYAIEGVPEFQELSKLINTYPEMRISAMIRLVDNGSRRSRPREGILDISNIGKARKICRWIKLLADRGYDFVYRRDFCLVFARISDSDFEKLLNRIQPDNFHWCETKAGYRSMLSHILK